MSKLHFVDQSKKSGVIVGAIFKKENGNLSIAFNGQIKEGDKFVQAPAGKLLLEVMYGDNFYAVKNNRKVAGDKLPDFIVYAYPEDDSAVEETPQKTPAEETPVA